MSAIIKQGRECLKVTNVLAYHETELITAVKSFKVPAQDQFYGKMIS
jgi:hypothetical protein